MLSEEEKKAIKLIKQYRKEIKDGDIKPIFILDTAINLITKLQKENEEKDKQIDLMAEIFYKRFKAELLLEYGFENEEQLKQYFKNQIKE